MAEFLAEYLDKKADSNYRKTGGCVFTALPDEKTLTKNGGVPDEKCIQIE